MAEKETRVIASPHSPKYLRRKKKSMAEICSGYFEIKHETDTCPRCAQIRFTTEELKKDFKQQRVDLEEWRLYGKRLKKDKDKIETA